MARKMAAKRPKTKSKGLPMVEADFIVLVIVTVACFFLLGVAGYFLK